MKRVIFYTPEQFAAIFKVSKSTVYNWIKKGELKAKKIGRVYRIPLKGILDKKLVDEFNLMELEDKKNLPIVQKELKRVRRQMWAEE